MARRSAQCFPYRPHDYMYDPIFSVSGPTDHYKAAAAAKKSTAQYQICPVFSNMFSDSPSRPRIQLVRRRQPPTPTYEECLKPGRSRDNSHLYGSPDLGADRSKFAVTIVNYPPKDWYPPETTPPFFTIEKVPVKHTEEKLKTRDVEVETIYRESTSQTDPWETPYKIIGKGVPEITQLDFLQWGNGLPAGKHELLLVERARMKAAWEKEIKLDIRDEKSLERFKECKHALELDEWAFREEEIKKVHEMRLKLSEKMLNEIHELTKAKNELKLKHCMAQRETVREEERIKRRKKATRDLRKLEARYKGELGKYKPPNIIEEHIDKKSEVYAPLMRNGEHPKRWHCIIDEKRKKYKAQFTGVENLDTLPKWLDHATKIDKKTLYSSGRKRQLCVRETKWTAPVLKQLHNELKVLSEYKPSTEKRPLKLRRKVDKTARQIITPEVEGVPKEEEDKYQALVRLQSVIKGRATQMMIYEGRDACRELIQELKHSKGLLMKQKEQKRKEKFRVQAQQRDELLQIKMGEKLQGALGKLQGIVVGSLLEFLNKELKRLLEERKGHAMCVLNEKERYVREAMEAGRRQRELRRRKEHDEMFKQIVKITQESVDVYLHEMITKGIDVISKEDGYHYVRQLAQKIEKEAEDAYGKLLSVDEEDEIAGNLILHVILPEVNKQILREKLAHQQRKNLKTLHSTIFSNFKTLPRAGIPESNQVAVSILEDIIKTIEEDSTSNLTETASVPSLCDRDYKDPVGLYLSQVMEQEDEFLGFRFLAEEYNDLNLRNDILETIMEVDDESITDVGDKSVSEVEGKGASEVKVSIVPEIKDSIAPDLKTSITPEVKDSIAPEVKTSIAPDVKTSIAPDVKTSIAPDVKTSIAPEVKDSIAPDVKTSIAPDVKTSIAPDVKTSIAPEVKDSIAPDVKTSIAPEVKASIAPDVKDSIAPEVKDSIAPDVKDSIAPEVKDSIAPEVKDSIAPEVKDSIAPEERRSVVSEIRPSGVAVKKRSMGSEIRRSAIPGIKHSIVSELRRSAALIRKHSVASEVKESVVPEGKHSMVPEEKGSIVPKVKVSVVPEVGEETTPTAGDT